ncbi:MAG: RdgB/HAM1 family non-canonical purine NTP pyrophosphatase [Rickettsiales bacterium]
MLLKPLKDLTIASSNPGKVSEFIHYLKDLPINISTLEGKKLEPPIEDGEDFESNSLIKAEFYSKSLNTSVLSDDSGLCIESLDGKPGINTAAHSKDSNKYDNILNAMQKRVERGRKAKFICVLCFLQQDNIPLFFEGECRGLIADKPKGELGFGFDAIFIPDGSEKTFAEMTKDEKIKYSARGNALRNFRDYITNNVL